MKLSKKNTLKALFGFHKKRPSDYQWGKAIVGAYKWDFLEVYKIALWLRDKRYIEMEEMNEMGKKEPVDIRLKITTGGIESLKDNIFKKILRFITKYIWQIIISIIIAVVSAIVASYFLGTT
jgi:hypothetical protein